MRRLTAAGLATALAYGFGSTASAQVALPSPVQDLVSPTAQPEQSGIGTRLGSFIFSPSLELSEEFQNNVFSTQSNTHSDFITIERPAFDLVSDWNVHALALHAEGDVQQYSRFSGENAGNVIVDGQGRLDVSNGQYLLVNAGYQDLQEARSSPDSIEAARLAGGGIAAEPTPYLVLTSNFRYVYAPGRIKLELDGTAINYEFTNTPTVGGGLAINGDRNRTEYTVAPEVGYEFLPGYQVYVQASGYDHDYYSKFDATPEHLQRDSDGYTAVVGIEFETNPLIKGTFYAGYQSEYFDDPRLSAIQGDYFGGSLTWTVTEATQLKLNLSRTILDTIVPGSSGFWDTQATLDLDQIIYDDLRFGSTFTFINSDYKGSGLNDDDYDVKGNLVWTLNRNVDLNASAEWVHQSSNQPGAEFDEEIVRLGVKLRL